MEGYLGILLLLMGTGCMAQTPTTVTISFATTPVNEGTALEVLCTLDMAAPREYVLNLAFDNTMSTTEEEFDHPLISNYCCVVASGATVGRVSIPTNTDTIIDIPTTGETLSITVSNAAAYTLTPTAGQAVIMNLGTPVAIRMVPTQSVIKIAEGAAATTATVTLNFLDSNNQPAALEEGITISVTFPNSGTTDTATGAGTDYTDPTPIAALTHTPGTEQTSATVEFVISTDALAEPLEVFDVLFGDGTAAPMNSITATGQGLVQIQIADDADWANLVVLQYRRPLPRRSENDVEIWAVSNEAWVAGWDVTDSHLPHNVRDCKRRPQEIGPSTGTSGLEYVLPKPERNSKARFNEFTFTRSQMIGGTAFTRTAYAYLTPTSREKTTGAVEPNATLLTVYPDATTTTNLDQRYCVSVKCDVRTRSSLRWWYIPVGGSKFDARRLSKLNGKTSVTFSGVITEGFQPGLYLVGRAGRTSKGWLGIFRVLQAPCPRNQFLMGTCMPSTNVMTSGPCLNGGVLDQVIDLCNCPPGFMGKTCELAVAEADRGAFGSSCQFKISDYIKDREARRGKCVTFSIAGFGTTCMAGWGGKDCCQPCKRGKYGAGCTQTCGCVDDCCDPVDGRCTNGCLPGRKNFNCI